MGVINNIKKVIKYYKKRGMEGKLNRKIVKQSIVETNFYEEYSSFTKGLKDKLNKLLVEDEYLEVILKPNSPDKAKYFERAMEDEQFNMLYDIHRTTGGEYSFKQKVLIET